MVRVVEGLQHFLELIDIMILPLSVVGTPAHINMWDKNYRNKSMALPEIVGSSVLTPNHDSFSNFYF